MTIVTVSVVSHGQGCQVAELLRDLSRQTIAKDLKIVVTLNIPETGPDPASHRGLRVTVIRNDRPKGFGANHNAALRTAATPWVIVINPDIRLYDHAMMERLVQHRSQDGIGLVAPLIRNSRGDREDSIRRNLDPVSLLGRSALRRRAVVNLRSDDHRFFWAAGMFMALPLTAWRAVGGFDERFFLYCEDYDLCARFAIRGYAIEIDETVEAVHDAQRSSRTSLRYLRWHLSSMVKVWRSAHFWKIWASDLLALARR